MHAIRLPHFVDDVSKLVPSSVPIPATQPGEYLIRITHCSPQHADILHAQGKHQNNHPKRGHVHCPFILGYSFAGVVERTTKTEILSPPSIGDRVFGGKIGAFAEYISVRPEHITRVPNDITNEVACALSGQLVSYGAVTHVAKVKAGETVLVSGASGGLGSGCCAVAKALGAKVIALTGDPNKARLMRRDMDVDSIVVTQGDWTKRIMELTEGAGVNVVLDSTGIVNQAITCLGYEGRVVILGFAGREGVMEEVKMNRLLLKSASVVGYRFGESGRRFPGRQEEIQRGFMEMMKNGKLQPLLFGHYEGLRDVGRALKDLADRKVYGKIVVRVGARQQRPSVDEFQARTKL